MRTEREVDAAKRAQSRRLSRPGASGKRKRCRKGKSCGSSCIFHSHLCLVDLPWVAQDMDTARKQITASRPNRERKSELQPHNVPANRVEDIEGVLEALRSSPVKEIDGEVGARNVNWGSGLENGAVFGGAGMYGAFVMVPPENLAKGLDNEFPRGVGVKYGKIKPAEVGILKQIGETGAGPRVIAAKYEDVPGRGARRGVIAMERIPGKTLRQALEEGGASKENLSDGYVRAMAKLHLAGIAHNDAHLSNAILQPDGNVKFIDFGLSTRRSSDILSEISKTISPSGANLNEIASGEVIKRVRGNLDRAYARGALDLGLALGPSSTPVSTRFRKALEGLDREERDKVMGEFVKRVYEGI